MLEAVRGKPPRRGRSSGGSREEGAGTRRSGFFVYRRTGDAAYGPPLVEAPLEETRFDDGAAPLGTAACYVVRAVASPDPLIESAPSNEACVEVRDVTAPAAPVGLVVLPREAGLELLWSPSAEADLAGYRIYRTAPGEPERVAEIEMAHSSWVDTRRPSRRCMATFKMEKRVVFVQSGDFRAAEARIARGAGETSTHRDVPMAVVERLRRYKSLSPRFYASMPKRRMTRCLPSGVRSIGLDEHLGCRKKPFDAVIAQLDRLAPSHLVLRCLVSSL